MIEIIISEPDLNAFDSKPFVPRTLMRGESVNSQELGFPVIISSTSRTSISNINPLYIYIYIFIVYTTTRVITSMVERIKLRVNNLWNFSQFLSTLVGRKWTRIWSRIAAWTSCQHLPPPPREGEARWWMEPRFFFSIDAIPNSSSVVVAFRNGISPRYSPHSPVKFRNTLRIKPFYST